MKKEELVVEDWTTCMDDEVFLPPRRSCMDAMVDEVAEKRISERKVFITIQYISFKHLYRSNDSKIRKKRFWNFVKKWFCSKN